MIFLVCGVPGSGKSWIINHFKDSHKIVHYDRHFNTPRADYARALVRAQALDPASDIVADCPLGVSEIISSVKATNTEITPVFVIEHADIVTSRYQARENKPIPKQHLGRIKTMIERARQYNAFKGTSSQVLKYLIERMRKD